MRAEGLVGVVRGKRVFTTPSDETESARPISSNATSRPPLRTASGG